MSNITTLLNNTQGSTSIPASTNTGTTGTTNTGTTSTTNNGTTGTTGQQAVDATSLMGTTSDFLTMLIAQLKYQDPTQPMTSTEFIDSISRLAQVEQSIDSNQYLSNISSTLSGGTNQMGSPVSYINQNISFSSAQFALTGGIGGFSYNLPATNTPQGVTMTITDSSGNVVVNTNGTSTAGANPVKWDGTDSQGNQLPDGVYNVTVQYPDPNNVGQFITVPTTTSGIVTGADFSGSEPMLSVSGIDVPLTAVQTIGNVTPANSTSSSSSNSSSNSLSSEISNAINSVGSSIGNSIGNSITNGASDITNALGI